MSENGRRHDHHRGRYGHQSEEPDGPRSRDLGPGMKSAEALDSTRPKGQRPSANAK